MAGRLARVPPRAQRAKAKFVRSRLRRSRIPRGPRIMQPVQYFKRTQYYTGWLATNTTLPQFKAIQPRLSDVPNYTEFTSLYDQYCIKKVVVTLIPNFNVNALPTAVPATWSILDYDGSFPNTTDGMLQYQNLKMKRGTSWHTRVFTPRILDTIYSSPLGSGYAPKRGQFIDAANPDVLHYGCEFMTQAIGITEDVYYYDMKITYYLAFKNVR